MSITNWSATEIETFSLTEPSLDEKFWTFRPGDWGLDVRKGRVGRSVVVFSGRRSKHHQYWNVWFFNILLSINQLKFEWVKETWRYRGLSWLHYHPHWMRTAWASYWMLMAGVCCRGGSISAQNWRITVEINKISFFICVTAQSTPLQPTPTQIVPYTREEHKSYQIPCGPPCTINL